MNTAAPNASTRHDRRRLARRGCCVDARASTRDYIADDGFTARVMAALPPRRDALPAWRKPAVTALVGGRGSAASRWRCPASAFDVAREAFRLFAAQPFALSELVACWSSRRRRVRGPPQRRAATRLAQTLRRRRRRSRVPTQRPTDARRLRAMRKAASSAAFVADLVRPRRACQSFSVKLISTSPTYFSPSAANFQSVSASRTTRSKTRGGSRRRCRRR